MSSRKVAVAIASGLALTGAEGAADIVSAPDDPDLITLGPSVDIDPLVLDAGDEGLFLPPLPEAADEVAFEEQYAQTWGGGTGNDGLISGPRAPGSRISPTGPKLDNVSKPAATPNLRKQADKPRRQKRQRVRQGTNKRLKRK